MDKSLQQTLYGNIPRSPFGSSGGSRTRQSSGSSMSSPRRQSAFFASSLSSLKKSTPLGNSRMSVSGRSNQSVLGIRSEFNVVESYGLQLPILVQEALTFSEKPVSMSVRCSPNGWAWFVQGRRLLIWQYKKRDARDEIERPTQKRGALMAQCRELTLPHCDIGHKASLVSVFHEAGQNKVSCIAVSPTGDARYWESIAHDNNSSDCNGILDGQEFDTLQTLPKDQGYLLVTTTSNLVHLKLDWQKGRAVLQHKPIKQQSGFLGGWSRRFSIIVGMSAGSDRETKFVNMCYELTSGDNIIATVLSDRWIQRWLISTKDNTEQLLFEDSEVIRKLREEFQIKFWNSRPESVDVKLHLLDMHESDGKFYILASAVNSMHSPQMCYGFAILSTGTDCMRPLNFIPIKYSQFYSTTTERECLNLRFIINRSQIYFYNDKVAYPLNLANPNVSDVEADKIEFHMHDDRILGAAVCDNIPLFFSSMHGVVSVTPSDFNNIEGFSPSINTTEFYGSLHEQTLFANTVLENTLTMYTIDPDYIYNEFKEPVNQLKAAFIYKLKRNTKMCNIVLNELLRSTADGQAGELNDANQLDKLVISMVEDLAEDLPAADPRWQETLDEPFDSKYPIGSSNSLQILTQLKDKSLALRHFVDFLHTTGIWDRLNAVPSSGGNILKSTCHVISDIHEKITAAIALRTIQNKFPSLIEDAIINVVLDWGEEPKGNLTAHDIFYVKLCKFQDIFQAFVDMANQCVKRQQQITKLATFIADLNSVVLNLVKEVQTFREEHNAIYTLPADKMDTYEYLPWTAMAGSYGIRDSLSSLVDISVRNGARCAHNNELKQNLYQQILELIDFILDGRKNYLDSVRDTEKYSIVLQQYESQRKELINILIDDAQYELAVKLAEKYLDFKSLVVICNITDNQERLDSYIKKYEEYDFSQIAINWHLHQKRRGDVFERFKGNQDELLRFLHDHPTLDWIQLIFNGDFERASKILFQVAQNETEYVAKKKTILSMAKLAAYAAAECDLTMQVEQINIELSVIKFQADINQEFLRSLGYDVENPKVLSVLEIINLYIAEENELANVSDFQKALELLNFLEDPYVACHKIWCAAILRDNWTDYDANEVADYLQNLLFFKLVEHCFILGELDNFLPPIEDILSTNELGDLPENKSFEFLLKYTYEYIYDIFKRSDNEEIMQN